MNITLQGNFESFPVELEACKPGLTDTADEVASPMFISVSRMSCIEDEKLLQEFLALFPNVHYSEELTAETTHLVMMNSRRLSFTEVCDIFEPRVSKLAFYFSS
ncbi:unnamed protein product [Cylicostephanus goldi]|uniref:Uncharacterized protein n=1 Tax=Cylicostephanus goldi TaxID=71465 RepID=A0A3P6RMP2_CYLGO|nr:unnamed protein product [Cylicostephanus goldi]